MTVNDKQRRVAEIYAGAGFINGGKAYMQVYETSKTAAAKSWSRLMSTNVDFQDYVESLRTEYLKDMKVDAQALIKEMSKIAWTAETTTSNRIKALQILGKWKGMEQTTLKLEGELPKIEIKMPEPEKEKEAWQQ